MLLIKTNSDVQREADDRGVALVLVLVAMLVGVIATVTIAAAVYFVISSNGTNKNTTQAFIAAESGRDKVVSQIVNGCTDNSLMAASGSNPTFTSQAYSTTGARPTSPSGLSSSCPTKDSTYILISSTGSVPSTGATSTIYTVYRWSATYSDVPGGVVTYFSGSVNQGVSHYTGDMVLRNGDWGCTNDSILDGDLYVLSGTVSFSQNCVVNGDVWSNGAVSSNSSGWHINANATSGSPGNLTTNGFVNFTSNGAPSVAGSISAKFGVTLSNAATGNATVGGSVTTQSTATVGSKWTTGTVTQNSPNPPVFAPTIDWLLAATKWIDLNNTSGWGSITPGTCSKLQNANTATAYVQPMLSSATTPLVLDFTACSSAVKLNFSAANVTRDVTIIVAPSQIMAVDLSGLTSTGTHQLMLIHSDASLDDRDSEGYPVPTCGNGNQNDSFGTSGSVSGSLHVMVYSPCGLSGTLTASFSGQLYTNDTTNFHAGSTYTCTSMSWLTALPKLGCAIKGPGGIVDTTSIVQALGALVNQTEQ